MKKITISKNSLRILSLSLESNPKGYNRKDLRQLDKIVLDVFSPIASYNENIEKLIKELKQKVKETPDKSVQLDGEYNEKINNVAEGEGKEKIEIKIEDADYDFVKAKWEVSENFRGDKRVRKSVMEIEDALEKAVNVEDSPKEQEKKTENATNTSEKKEEKITN